jgi:hypothetical protein
MKIKLFLRVSLRGAILLLTIFCLWLGYLTFNVRQQKNAVDRIRRLGGSIPYDWQAPVDVGGGRFTVPTGPSVPKWFRALLGDDYFQTVTGVSFKQKEVDSSVLNGLPHLERVGFYQCNVSDLGVFAQLSRLKDVSLERNCISDVSPLGTLRNLYTLDLSDNLIEDCTPLCGLKGLYLLDVQGNPLDQSQIEQIVRELPEANKTWSTPK